jgi:CRISPR-associated protein Cmr1
MKTLSYEVKFLTPAFLGNAEQSGQWRTPPFKALLRQWWRVAYAADRRFEVDLAEMRREEGRLFGNAWLSHHENGREVADHCKSLLRMRLDRWEEGSLKKAQWPSDSSVTHPEVKNRQGGTVPVGSTLYLGYGPLTYDNQRRATTLKANAAIQPNESATLSIAMPETDAPLIQQALWLMDRYGTLGGRSRNGWGSFALLPLPLGEGRGEGTPLTGAPPLRDWKQALHLDWPHAIGQDDNKSPLIWQTKPCADWKELMRELAIIKIGLRTQFKFTTGNNAPAPEARHWLSHPVTRHNVAAWRQGRLPNSLRFKVRAAPDDPKQLVGVIFHVSCRPPDAFQPDHQAIEKVWATVHAFLGNPARNLTRIKE